MLKIDKKAPDFKLQDQDGKIHKLSDYVGKLVLIYFYPKDDTPGCTKEACAIRDNYEDFEKLGVQVFGISKDTPESHKKFEKKYDLPFTLLADTKREVIKKYDAIKEIFGNIGTKRISYLIGKDGKILKIYPKVDPTTHALEILEDSIGFQSFSFVYNSTLFSNKEFFAFLYISTSFSSVKPRYSPKVE